MAAPTAYQQGQGLAQIFQGNMAADVYAYQQQLRAQQEAERRKRADLAAKELSGQFEALNKKNIFETRDTDEFRNKIKDVQDKYSGKWEELYRGDTPLRRDLEKDLLDISLWADQSAASKKELQGIWKDAFQDNADKYTDEQRGIIENLMVTPGSFQVPYKQLIPFENINLEDKFRNLAYEPAAKEAVDRFTSDKSWRGLESYGSFQQTKLPDESVEAHWSQFIADPQVQNALYHQYGKEAEAAGMELNEYVKQNTPFYERLKIDRKKTASGLISKDGDNKSFDPSVLTPVNLPKVIGKDFEVVKKTGSGNFYPLNFPVTVQTNSGAFDWASGDPISKDLALSGTVAGLVTAPTKNGSLNKDGSVGVHAVVRTTDGYDVVVPIEQVYNQGKTKGYDMDNIVNGLFQLIKTQPLQMGTPKKKQISVSEIPAKAAAAGYSTEEYTKLLNQNGVQIVE